MRDSTAKTAPRRPDVVLFVIDTLRVDRVGTYGSNRGLTPNIDRLAQEALVFERAVAQSSWTRPAMATVFSGLRPDAHGVHSRDFRLSPEVETLAERLRQSGYRTAGFSSNPNSSAASGVDQGFDTFELLRTGRAKPLLRAVRAWLRTPPEEPFLLYVHILDPHSPYEPVEPLRSRFAPDVTRPGAGTRAELEHLLTLEVGEREPFLGDLRALYDAEVYAADGAMQSIIDRLRTLGRWENTLFILFSDHGEEFNEHGWLEHGKNLHTETLDVPLLIKPPLASGKSAGRVADLADHSDLLPTVLAASGLDVPSNLPGVDLLAATPDGRRRSDRAVLSHLIHGKHRWVGLTNSTHRYLRRLEAQSRQTPLLYDRVADPGESRSIAGQLPELVARLEAQLVQMVRADRAMRVDAVRSEIDEETRRDLQALGYLGN